jgi:N-acetylglucosamine malate deacetylase 2
MTLNLDDLKPLLGTTLVLVAHPDDEVVTCGLLMQKMRKAIVVFATDGAPHNESFWRRYGSRSAYADIRRQEARQALAGIGASPIFLSDRVMGGIPDQELFLNLPGAAAELEVIVAETRPDCILTSAYEGGHPDHDAACFLGSILKQRLKVPVWEGPLYHRNADGSPAAQTFPELTGAERRLRADGPWLAQEKEKKMAMFRAYKSQGLTLEHFRPDQETFRPLAGYDFTRPPLPWKLNYEHWQWPMTGTEVSAKFKEFLQRRNHGRGV